MCCIVLPDSDLSKYLSEVKEVDLTVAWLEKCRKIFCSLLTTKPQQAHGTGEWRHVFSHTLTHDMYVCIIHMHAQAQAVMHTQKHKCVHTHTGMHPHMVAFTNIPTHTYTHDNHIIM